jgi:glycerophosphoryl diester phosphodiesterase
MRKPIVIGHRGAAAHAPENTLHSFETAVKLGADMIELDVQETKDGELICIHDYDVARTTNGAGLVSELTLAEIRDLDINSGHKIPLLSEVFDNMKNKISINIEIKVLDIETKLVNLIDQFGITKDVLVSSFFHDTLRILKNINSEIRTAILLNQPIEDTVNYALNLNADGINPLFYTLEPNMIELAHAENLVVYPWTVNLKESMVELLTMGVDGIITDYPDIARSVIESLDW